MSSTYVDDASYYVCLGDSLDYTGGASPPAVHGYGSGDEFG